MNLTRLKKHLLSQIDQIKTHQWMQDQFNKSLSVSGFTMAFGLINRKIPKQKMYFPESIAENLLNVNPDFHKANWLLDEACRLTLLLDLDLGSNMEVIKKLLSMADIKEQIIIYKSIQYFDNAVEFSGLVSEGIRTNVISIFDAISLHNSFPTKYLNDLAWNQMVLKAFFMERPIYQIQGIDDRISPILTSTLYEYAKERWSANRLVSPELWRFVKTNINDAIFKCLKQMIIKGSAHEKIAAIKALQECESEKVNFWFAENNIPQINKSWELIGMDLWGKSTT